VYVLVHAVGVALAEALVAGAEDGERDAEALIVPDTDCDMVGEEEEVTIWGKESKEKLDPERVEGKDVFDGRAEVPSAP
jgi:hypothetical protein